MKKRYVIAAGLIILSLTGTAQIIDFEKDKYWVDGGIGNYVPKAWILFNTWNINLNLQKEITLFKVKFLNHKEIIWGGAKPSENFYEFSSLIGTGVSSKYVHVIFSGGLGLFGGNIRGEFLYSKPGFLVGTRYYYELDNFITVSIPLEISLYIKPVKNIGFGVTLFGNINTKKSLFGFVLKVGVGKFH